MLGGPGGREFATFEHEGELYIVMVRFLTGTPKDPKFDLDSILFRFEAGKLMPSETFATLGATGAAAIRVDRKLLLVVAESLTADVRFRADTRIYRVS